MSETSASPILTLGTRGSPLALAQAYQTRDLLVAHLGCAAEAIAVEILTTKGDQLLDRSLAEAGGKGLFVKELDEALLSGRIDIAVHSSKDVPTILPQGLVLPAFLEREDVRDAFISPKAQGLADLPSGALVGTASLRRQAQVLRARPDLRVAIFRGNVQTRLRKLEEGQADATFLALAGLRRLGMEEVLSSVIETEAMLPAVAQGAIGLSCRADDETALAALAALDHAPTRIRVSAERAFLRQLDGSCRTPLAALATLAPDGALHLRGEILSVDGQTHYAGERRGAADEAEAMGADLAEELLTRAGPAFMEALRAAG
ncbi:MAG: hydroxymethylbilane synthase [Neomegalonema sp.]|nr:hydroxymethylbilane synthase [Neomegalonema sp.]